VELILRIENDVYFMEITKIVAKRSTCVRRHVGAILVKDNHIIATGYNGAPRNTDHCTEKTCRRKYSKSGEDLDKCIAVHAEINVIIQCALSSTNPEGSILYCLDFPCLMCMKALINAKIKEIVYLNNYNHFHEKLYDQIIIRKYDNKDIVDYDVLKQIKDYCGIGKDSKIMKDYYFDEIKKLINVFLKENGNIITFKELDLYF